MLGAGTAWVAIRPNMAGFTPAVAAGTAKAGAAGGSRFGGAFGKAAKVGLLAAVAGIAVFATKSVKGFLEFDDAMTKSLAIMGEVSGPMRKQMERAARQVGKTTQFSATQAADSYFFLASAGMSAQQSIKAMPAVAKFAAAGNFDLATATDLATDAQSALGLAVDNPAKNLKNLTRVTDVFVKANTLANTSVTQISEAMTNKAGAAMRAVSMDIEAGSAVLAAFADQGVKGAEAGTQFSIVLRDLQTKAIKNGEAFKKAGVKVFDSEGNLRNMADVMGDLEGHLDGMSAKQKKAALSTLGFSDKSMGALTTLLGTSDAIRGYEKELRNAGGTTDEVAKKQLKSFTARIDILKSKVSDFGLTVGKGIVTSMFALGEGFASGAAKGKGFLGTLSSVGAFVKNDVLPVIRDLGEKLMSVLGPGLKEVGALVQGQLVPAFQKMLPVLQPVAAFLLKVFGDALVGVIRGAIQTIKGLVNVIAGMFKLVVALVHGDWAGAWAAVKQILSGALNAVLGAIRVWWNAGILALFKKGVVMLTKGIWVKLWKSLSTLASKGLTAVKGQAVSGLKLINRAFVGAVKGYVSIWTGLFRLLVRSAVAGWKALRSTFGGAMAGIRTAVATFAAGIRARVKGAFDFLVSAVKAIPGRLRSLGSSFASAGKALIQAFVNGLKNAAGIISGIAGNVWTALRTLLNGAIGRINAALRFTIDLPGPKDLHVDVGKIPMLAVGARNFRGGLAIVGERGPELVDLPRGSHVIPNHRLPSPAVSSSQWRDMGGRDAGGGDRHVHQTFPTVDASATTVVASRALSALAAMGG